MITIELVLAIHQTILEQEPGLKGQPDIGKLDFKSLSEHLQKLASLSFHS